MKILTLNVGSSSLKSALFEMPEKLTLATGAVERLNSHQPLLKYITHGQSVSKPCSATDHVQAMMLLLERLTHSTHGVITHIDQIDAVGHRVVHGGELSDSALVDGKVLAAIGRASSLAPLHNPPALRVLEAATHALRAKPHVAVFDTSFHSSMPPQAFLYAIPYRLYEEHQVRAYGFHGTSHRYVASRAARMLDKEPDEPNLITLHLDNGGCSAAAVRGGQSVDTSMGLTPLAGLVMGTRCGDVDPALFHFLTEQLGMTPEEIYEMLNHQSGLTGLSGISNDVREILDAEAKGNERARIALDVFAYRVRKYIGAYWAVLGRLDAVVFTAAIGENSPDLRARCCLGLEGLGIELDIERNRDALGVEAVVSTDASPVSLLVIPTNEELQIATETYEIVQKEQQ